MRSPTSLEIEQIYNNLNRDEGTIETAAERAGVDISEMSKDEIARRIEDEFNLRQCPYCNVWTEHVFNCDSCGADFAGSNLDWDSDPDEW